MKNSIDIPRKNLSSILFALSFIELTFIVCYRYGRLDVKFLGGEICFKLFLGFDPLRPALQKSF